MAENKLFFCYNHQGKADSLLQALRFRGWQETKNPIHARFILTDFMLSSGAGARRRNLDIYREQGIKIFIYPHAARPNIFWDFPGQDFPNGATAQFVPAPGHAQIMRAYGYPHPIEAVGWHLCKIKPFEPREKIREILFGPIHPNSNGFLSSIDKEINREAFDRLLTLRSDETSIAVRYLGDLRSNGLSRVGGVRYVKGEKDLSTEEIDRADLVVSHQTFAYLAVARGVPTLMMGEDRPPRWGSSEGELSFVKSWEKYRDLLEYPLDILQSDPRTLANWAITTDHPIRDWRERLIGKQFESGRFVSTLERYL